jgi:type II secretory pathway component PulF
MLTYKWSARDWTGLIGHGTEAAASAATLEAQLRTDGWFNITVIASRRPWTLPAPVLSAVDRLALTHQLAHLIGAGLPLTEAIQLLRDGKGTATLKAVLTTLQTDLMAGHAYSVCIGRQVQHFSDLYVGVIAAAEEGGQLASGLQHLAHQLQSDARRKAQIQSALRYPALIAGVAALVVTLIMTLVIPSFEAQFAQRGTPLPWLTQQLIWCAQSLRTWGGPASLGLLLVAFIVKRQLKRPAFRLFCESQLFRIPGYGHWLKTVYSAALAKTLHSLLQTGLPLSKALTHLAQAQQTLSFQRVVHTVHQSVNRGVLLSVALGASPLVSPLLPQLCRVGEATGALDTLLQSAATSLDSAANEALEKWTAALEPLSILILGLIIGTMVLAMYWPVFQIGQTI